VVEVSSARPVRPRATPVDELAEWLEATTPVVRRGDLSVVVTGVCLNTARIRPGDLFAALPGARVHGATFVADALARGAVAVLTDEDGLAQVPADVPVIAVARPRAVLGRVAAHLYGDPASALKLLGITGTQGKTTTARMLEQGLGVAGIPAAVIGTIGTRVCGHDVPTQLTTPEAPDLHGLFALMREQGADVCAMEVSSHALVLGRVDGVVFDVAVFLNLGRDHLDFHDDVDDYFAAKASLFTPERAARGLTNIDDEWGRLLLERATVPMQTYSATGREADWQARDVVLGADGSDFTLVGGGQSLPVHVPVPGAFNVSNALAAIAAAAMLGLDAPVVAAGIGGSGGVPGRLERIDAGQDFTVVVDYAHKPDAVEAVLTTLRPLTDGRVIVVIGAGGDRDPGKRAIMGEIAGRLAGLVIVTDDNPRTEDPAMIRAAVLEGACQGTAEVLDIGDRRLAIREAVRRAEPGDVVLIAGKGHETGQEIHGEVHPFDDRLVAREEIEGVGSTS
jgi:UDP-N-acetylmuramoyl-L-alanyl-D-glutamate--2,6-diaminopimelate ligase